MGPTRSLPDGRNTETRAQTVENNKLPGAAPITTHGGNTEIAANSEVLDWARGEALLNRVESQDQARARDQQRETAQDTVAQKRLASGLTHQQLSGAAAPSGGWFSETMLTALASYQESAGLNRSGSSTNQADKSIGELDLRPDE